MASTTALLAAIPSLPRAALSQLTARMIDHMDDLDGDPDMEATGDERDTSCPEWDRLWPVWQQLGQPFESTPTPEDDEDGRDAEEEEAYD